MKLESYKHFYIPSINESKIYYCRNFEKPDPNKQTLIFNYGLVCSNYHWMYQIPHFEEEFQIILHDYRGHFNSAGNEDIESITFENIAIDINEILSHCQIESAHFLGHSMGVNVCLEFAKKYPQKVSSLILISGTVFPVTNIMFDTNIMEIVAPLSKSILDIKPQLSKTFWSNLKFIPLVSQFIKQGGFNAKMVSDEFIQIYLSKISELQYSLFFQLFDQLGTHDIATYLADISSPMLVMGGDRDKVIPNYMQEILSSQVANSELYIIKDGSHVPQVDFPEIVNKRIDYFLKGLI